jgi:hypothetical protein
VALAAADEKLKAAVEQEKAPLIETLRDMVMIESGSSDIEGLAKMADFTDGRLKALGAATRRQKTTAGTGADIVVGTFEGTGTRKLMLIAHMDTVYQRGILASEPYHVDGTHLRARHCRRQGRDRRDPTRAEEPEGGRLARLRHPHGVPQSGRRGRLDRIGRIHFATCRPPRCVAVLRADGLLAAGAE